MAFRITNAARKAAESGNLNPNLVLEIEGVPTKYGAVPILKYIRIGDPGLLIGDTWRIGGLSLVDDQLDALKLDGSTTEINQKLDIDKGSGGTISGMTIALIDIRGAITELITPGQVVDDLLARKCKIWLGFSNTAFPEDYIVIHRGIIESIESGAGFVTLAISHPDKKKLQNLFQKIDTDLASGINNSVTTIPLTDSTGFLEPVLGPDGFNDPTLKFYVRIDDELIQYTGISGNNLTGCTRGALFTTAASHSSGTQASSFYRLTGNAIDLALKLMLSGVNDYFVENVPVSAFNVISPTENVPNALFFFADAANQIKQLSLSVGDYATTTGASNGANNVSLKQISEITETDDGIYLVFDGVSFVDETGTSALVKFRSQYDTLGEGMGFGCDEVDVAEHLRIKQLFLSSLEYDFYLSDTMDAKDFLETEIYLPAAAFSLPRKSQASLGYHIGPIPGDDIKTLSTANVKKASDLRLKRGISKNFYNTIVYKFEQDELDDQNFKQGVIEYSATSRNRIKVGTTALVIKSKGLRKFLNGQNEAVIAAHRRLKIYEFGAEYLDSVEVLLGDTYNVEIGDIVVLDNSGLNISDTKTASRTGPPKMFLVVNKAFNIRKGMVRLSIIDTAFSTAARYGLISPSSEVLSGTSGLEFKITKTGPSQFGAAEGKKWSRYESPVFVRVRSSDFTTRNAVSQIQSISGNTIKLVTNLGFTPQPGDMMELAYYPQMSDELKLRYVFMTDDPAFGDGKPPYNML